MTKQPRGQHPPSRATGIPIEFVEEPHPGFKAKAHIDKSHPGVAEEWFYERNGHFGPEDFTYGSHVSAWWQCREDSSHIWRQTIKDRCLKDRGCPFCAGKYVSHENSLAHLYPQIAREWAHELNKDLTPFDLTGHTHQVVWWICNLNKKHVWNTAVNQRTSGGRGCPHCRDERKLDLREFPQALQCFDRAKNKDVNPYSFSTKLEVWWRCRKDKKHSWSARFRKRSTKFKCPLCSLLAYRFPKLAAQLHPTKNDKETLQSISYGSNKKVWWRCSENPRHSWLESPKNRVKQKGSSGCTRCNT